MTNTTYKALESIDIYRHCNHTYLALVISAG